jgi:hypothetical protein
VSPIDDNILTIFVVISSNVESSSILDVDNCSIVILEKLEPSGIGAPNLQVIGTSTTLDVNRLGVLSYRFDSLGCWI